MNSHFKALFFIVFLVLFLNLLFLTSAVAQEKSREYVISTYFFNIPKHIVWKDEDSMKKFRIGVYGNDKLVLEKLQNYATTKQIKNTPIEIVSFEKLVDIEKTHILYVANDKVAEIEVILEKISGNNALMITDRSTMQKFVMINLFLTEKGSISIEINKSNIIYEGFTISPSITMLGGTELDVAELFKETEASLKTEKELVKAQKEELAQQKKELETQKSKIEAQRNEISNQLEAIQNQQQKIDKQKEEFADLQKDISEQQEILKVKMKVLDEQMSRIATQELLIKEQEGSIAIQDSIRKEGAEQIEKQNEDILKHQELIKNQKTTLNTQSKEIETQKSIIYISVAFIIVFLIMTFFIVRSNRIKKRINAELEAKSEDIRRQNVEIIEQKDKLNETNLMLAEEKNRVEAALTELKSAQVKLVNSEKMASLGQLTAGIAHEINNPVNYIAGGIVSLEINMRDRTELIEAYEKITPENVNEMLIEIAELREDIEYDDLMSEMASLIDSIKIGARQTADIVKGLRTFSRLDKDTLKPSDVHENLDSTLVMLHSKFKEKIEIVKDYSDIPHIECYAGKLNQVYMNLLNNAIQAIENEGFIYISTKFIECSDTVEIKIRDTGVGIPKEIQNKIFDPFFTSKDVGEGTGLGLSISLGIIEDHHGTITVDSTVGVGTEFTIQLPVNLSRI